MPGAVLEDYKKLKCIYRCFSGSSGSNGRFCEVIGTRVLADSTSYLLAYKLQWLLSNSAFDTTLRRSTDPACETAFGSNQSHPKPCFCDTFLQRLKVMFCSILYQKQLKAIRCLSFSYHIKMTLGQDVLKKYSTKALYAKSKESNQSCHLTFEQCRSPCEVQGWSVHSIAGLIFVQCISPKKLFCPHQMLLNSTQLRHALNIFKNSPSITLK